MQWTMREVDIALRKSRVRKHNLFARQASLHGVTVPLKGLPPLQPPKPKVKGKEVTSDVLDALMAQALERKKKGT